MQYKQLSAEERATIVPLVFAPGDACQFDWSQEAVQIAGVLQTIKVAHFRMAYSRQMFVVAYPCEKQEMVLTRSGWTNISPKSYHRTRQLKSKKFSPVAY